PDRMRVGADEQIADLRRNHPPSPQPQRPGSAHRLRRRQPAQRDPLLLMMPERELTPALTPRGEAGFTILEVLIAALLLTLASAAIFGALAASTRNGARAKSTQVALDRAQQEMEKLHSLSYEELVLEHAPAPSSNPLNPNHRVVSGSFALQPEPPSEYAPMVVNVEGEGGIKPGPIKFEEGEVRG